MKKKFLLKINKQLCGTVLVDITKLRDKDLGKKEIIRSVSTSPKLREKFSGKEIVSVAFSLAPKREINLIVGKIGTALKIKKETQEEIKFILENLKKGNIRKAEEETDSLTISNNLNTLWWSDKFIDKISEPLNSAVLEGCDFDYYYSKRKENKYYFQEAKRILTYLEKAAKATLAKSES